MALWIVGQHHDNNNNNNKSRGFIWCREEVKCVIDILADENFSQMLDSEVFKSWVNGRRTEATKPLLNSASTAGRHEIILSILTKYLLAAVARQNISRLFIPVAGADTTSSSRSQMWLFCSLLCSRTCEGTEPKGGNASLFWNNFSSGSRCERTPNSVVKTKPIL